MSCVEQNFGKQNEFRMGCVVGEISKIIWIENVFCIGRGLECKCNWVLFVLKFKVEMKIKLREGCVDWEVWNMNRIERWLCRRLGLESKFNLRCIGRW